MKKVNLILALVAIVFAVMAGALLQSSCILPGVLYIFLAALFIALAFIKKTPVKSKEGEHGNE